MLGALAVSAYADSGTGGPKLIPNTDISLTWSPSTLWPPDRTFSTIVITAHDLAELSTFDTSADTYSITVTAITSNEDCPDPAGPDWTGVGNSSGLVSFPKAAVVAIQLRAERCSSGNGRTYTITVVGTDDETTTGGVRKTGTTTFTVTVPHDQGN
jgi:hypothetical protein